MPPTFRAAALAALLPLAAAAQVAPSALRCEVERVMDFAAAQGSWKESAGAPAPAFSVIPMLAPDQCTSAGCTTYTSGWVMVSEPPGSGASTCWEGMTPDALICDLMGVGQALVNLADRTALITRYEGFTFGLPGSRVSVSLATCADQG